MKVFLAGLESSLSYSNIVEIIREYRPYCLTSFAYMNKQTIDMLPYYNDFLLDSGAFTFVKQKKQNIDWNDYAKKYAKFVYDYNIEKYFELDIDALIGYDAVKTIRKELEKQTKTQCIPVWHISRGLKDFEETTKQYPYVAVGGINFIQRELLNKYKSSFPTLIRIAHQNGAKLHGLGYTSFSGLKQHHFDSVDSTSWLAGARFGMYYYFNHGELLVQNKPKGYRIKEKGWLQLTAHNLNEWIKYQKYMDKNY